MITAAVCFLVVSLLCLGVSAVQGARFLRSGAREGALFQSAVIMAAVGGVWIMFITLIAWQPLLFVVNCAATGFQVWLFRKQVRRDAA